MPELHFLYVDQLSPDRVKGVVSDTNSVFWNLIVIKKALGLFASDVLDLGEINGISIVAVGRYICMIIRASSTTKAGAGMILLNLVGRDEVAHKMARQFGNDALEERFMQVYDEVMRNPDRHQQVTLMVAKAPRLFK